MRVLRFSYCTYLYFIRKNLPASFSAFQVKFEPPTSTTIMLVFIDSKSVIFLSVALNNSSKRQDPVLFMTLSEQKLKQIV